MAPKVHAFFEFLGRLFTGHKREVPTDQDELGAYPLRMQISAIPERRYLRTTRLLAVLTFINIGILIAIAGVFVHDAARIDVQLANQRVVNMYAMDPERKVIQAAEYHTKSVPAMWLVQEQAVRNYIQARSSYSLDAQKQNAALGFVKAFTRSDLHKKFAEEEAPRIANEARSKNVNKEVHIYSVNQTPTGLWEALVDVFDMPPYNPYKPLCFCSDNTPTCISCKEEHNQGRHRYRIYVRMDPYRNPTSLSNPFGFQVSNYAITPQIIHPEEKFWGVPSVLKPDL